MWDGIVECVCVCGWVGWGWGGGLGLGLMGAPFGRDSSRWRVEQHIVPVQKARHSLPPDMATALAAHKVRPKF